MFYIFSFSKLPRWSDRGNITEKMLYHFGLWKLNELLEEVGRGRKCGWEWSEGTLDDSLLLAPAFEAEVGAHIRNTGDAIEGGCQQKYGKPGGSTHWITQNAKPVRITSGKYNHNSAWFQYFVWVLMDEANKK